MSGRYRDTTFSPPCDEHLRGIRRGFCVVPVAMDQHERCATFDQEGYVPGTLIRRSNFPRAELAGKPSFDGGLVTARNGARGVTRQVGEFHDDARESRTSPTRLRRPIRQLGK